MRLILFINYLNFFEPFEAVISLSYGSSFFLFLPLFFQRFLAFGESFGSITKNDDDALLVPLSQTSTASFWSALSLLEDGPGSSVHAGSQKLALATAFSSSRAIGLIRTLLRSSDFGELSSSTLASERSSCGIPSSEKSLYSKGLKRFLAIYAANHVGRK